MLVTPQPKASVFRLKAWSGRADVLRRRAETELRELAMQLHADGAHPLDVLLEVGRLAAQLRQSGSPLPAEAALAAVRGLPELSTFDPLDSWVQRLGESDADALAESIDLPAEQEQDRRRRAWALATWLNVKGGSFLAEEVVQAAEAIARRHAGEGVTGV